MVPIEFIIGDLLAIIIIDCDFVALLTVSFLKKLFFIDVVLIDQAVAIVLLVLVHKNVLELFETLYVLHDIAALLPFFEDLSLLQF